MITLFAEIKFFSFCPKPLDYNRAFCSISFRTHNSSLEGAMKLEFAPFCSPRDALPMITLFAEIKIFSFWPKPLDYNRAFCSISFHTHNSSLERAMKLKFAPFCSPRDALSDDNIVCRNQNFQFLAETPGL